MKNRQLTTTPTSNKNYQKKLPQLTQLNLEQLDGIVGGGCMGGRNKLSLSISRILPSVALPMYRLPAFTSVDVVSREKKDTNNGDSSISIE